MSVGCNRNPIIKMDASGVPQLLILANTLAGLQQKKEMMEVILAKLDNVPNAVNEAMRKKFPVGGAVPITREDMEEIIRSSFEDVRASIDDMTRRHRPPNALLETEPAPTESVITVAAQRSPYATWTWGGRLHPIPQGSTFPM